MVSTCPNCKEELNLMDNIQPIPQQGYSQQGEPSQLVPQANVEDDESDSRGKKLRNSAGGFAIMVGIFTLIGAFVLPLVRRHSLIEPAIMVQAIIMVILAVSFLVLGGIFIAKGNFVVAILLLIALIVYVLERLLMIFMSFATGDFDFFNIVWLVLGISAMVSVIRYLMDPY